jgi:hypothetical protein
MNLSSLAEIVANQIAKRSGWAAVGMAVLFLARGLLESATRPLWFDEFFAVFFARMRDPVAIATAVRTAADPIPPAYYILEAALCRWIPFEALALRLAASVGMAAAVLCTFACLRQGAGPLAALIGAGFLFLTAGISYAAEARPYGLLLGCTAGAALAWQRAHRSWLHAAALGGCLSLATAVHYYAVFVVIAFAAAEIWLLLRFDRIRGSVWLALLAASIPLVLQWPFLERAREVFGPHFWARPDRTFFTRVFRDLFPDVWVGIPLAGFLAGVSLLARRGATAGLPQGAPSPDGPDEPEFHKRDVIIAPGFALLFILPAAAFAVTWLFQGGLYHRYALPVVLGGALVFGAASARMPAGHQLATLLALLGIGGFDFAVLVKRTLWGETPVGEAGVLHPIRPVIRSLDSTQGPLAISSGTQFLGFSLARPEKARHRVFYLTDPSRAVASTGTDSIDKGLLGLRMAGGLNVMEYEQFIRRYRRFSVLAGHHWTEWLVPQLVRDGCRLTMTALYEGSMLFRAECDAPGAGI